MDNSSQYSEFDNLKLNVESRNVVEVERITGIIHKSLQGKGKAVNVPCDETVKILNSILQNIPSFQACKNVFSIVYQYIILKSSKSHILKVFTNNGLVQFLFAAFVKYKEEWPSNSLVTYRLHTVIKKLAKNDKKICVKARLSGAAKVTASLVKIPKSKFSTQCRLLSCLKIFLASGVTSSHLGKEGLLASLLMNINLIKDNSSFKPQLLLALTLETLSVMLKLKVNVKRLVQCNGVAPIINLMETWYKSESKIGRRISKNCLMIISQTTEIKLGCRAIIDGDGKNKLSKIATSLPPGRENDNTIVAIFSIIVKCSPKITVPASSFSPISFSLPNHSFSSAVLQKCLSGSEDDLSGDSTVSADDSHDESEHFNEMMENLKTENEYSKEELMKFASFFSEQPCYHPSSMQGYPCCSLVNSGPYIETTHEQSAHAAVCKGNRLSQNSDNVMSEDFCESYRELFQSTKRVASFVKVAYPDMTEAVSVMTSQSLLKNEDDLLRKRMLFELDQMLESMKHNGEVIYDLDALTKSLDKKSELLDNEDESKVGKISDNQGTLQFESRFESGNLRKAIQIDDNAYDLLINPDINIGGRHQWFYFQVSGMEKEVSYTFNIINCEKLNSQFNFGMQPVLYSVKEAMEGRPGWRRVGTHICYHKNHYMKYTTTFTLKFPHSWDICYMAYHFPYTYTTLQVHLKRWSSRIKELNNIYYQKQKLSKTLGNNDSWLLTITQDLKQGLPVQERRYIFLTARVHPGETNASWAMKGSIDFLISNDPLAEELRSNFIFKIIPMLNPDGVINGNQRCSLLGVDLNRCWSRPSSSFHPVIFHAKGLFTYLQTYLCQSPLAYCDYHGHSRKKNVFMFGCSPRLSWFTPDRSLEDHRCCEMFVKMCSKFCSALSFSDSSFTVEKSRESTARVAVWRTFQCAFSYTLESSYCGFNQGRYEGLHITTKILEEMGCQLCHAFVTLISSGNIFLPDRPLNTGSEGTVDQGTVKRNSDSLSNQSDLDDSASNDATEDDDHHTS